VAAECAGTIEMLVEYDGHIYRPAELSFAANSLLLKTLTKNQAADSENWGMRVSFSSTAHNLNNPDVERQWE
jgi:hypothetical protein